MLFKINATRLGNTKKKQLRALVNVCVMLCHGARFSLGESEIIQTESRITELEGGNEAKLTLMLQMPSVGNYLVKTDSILVTKFGESIGVKTKKFIWVRVE